MEQLAEWLVNLIETVGYPGVFAAMFMGNALIPIPVEIIMIPAGYLVQQHQMQAVQLLATGIAGDVSGSLFAYYIAYHFGRLVLVKYGKYVFLDEKKIGMLDKFFANHGEISTLTGRLVPGLRHFMAFPAGLSHMNAKKFAAFTGLGGGLWMAILIGIGYVIGGNKTLVKHYLSYITGAVVGGMVVVIIVYMQRQPKTKMEEDSGNP